MAGTALILNADDFGHCLDTVEATEAMFARCELTSASLMPNMPQTDRAVAFARRHPEFGFGVHLVLAGDSVEAPLTTLGAGTGLVDEEGRFERIATIRRRALLGQLDRDAVRREVQAQIAYFVDHGIALTHVDSHHHVHRHEPFRSILASVMPAFSLRRVRNAQNLFPDGGALRPARWLGYWWGRQLRRRFVCTDGLLMLEGREDLPGMPSLVGQMMKMHVVEIGVHPGDREPWRRAETQALPRLRNALIDAGARTIHWGDIPLA